MTRSVPSIDSRRISLAGGGMPATGPRPDPAAIGPAAATGPAAGNVPAAVRGAAVLGPAARG